MRLWLVRLAIGLFAWTIWVGCHPPCEESQERPRRDPGGRVQVSLRNDSAVDFDRVVVSFPNRTEDYVAVPSGGASDYRAVEMAYRYAYVEAHGHDQKYVLQPFDYTGEKLLEPGRYSYVLDLVQGELTLELVEH